MPDSISRNLNEAYLRHQSKRAIKKKERIIQDVFKVELEDYVNSQERGYTRGMLDKGKVHCSCEMCKPEKYFNIEHYKTKERKRIMQEEIDECLKERL